MAVTMAPLAAPTAVAAPVRAINVVNTAVLLADALAAPASLIAVVSDPAPVAAPDAAPDRAAAPAAATKSSSSGAWNSCQGFELKDLSSAGDNFLFQTNAK